MPSGAGCRHVRTFALFPALYQVGPTLPAGCRRPRRRLQAIKTGSMVARFTPEQVMAVVEINQLINDWVFDLDFNHG